MSETLSLLRLFWAGSRTALAVLFTLAIVGFLTAQLAIWIAPNDFGRSIGGAILIFTVVPVIVSSVALFNFSDNIDIHDIPSGCSHWLLRMPVKSWKIVAVPVLSKTLWITCVWVAFCQVLPRMYVEIDRLPMQAPIFGFSAAAIWLLMLSWRPFYNGNLRMVSFLLSALAIYLGVIGIFVAPIHSDLDWRPVTTKISQAAAIVFYFVAIATTWRAVSVARSSATGLVSESRPNDGVAVSGKAKNYRTTPNALAHHDWLHARGWIIRLFWFGVLPSAILISLLPLTAFFVMAPAAFFYLAAFAAGRIGANTDRSMQLPIYLAAKPIDSAVMIWTRLVMKVIVSTVAFLCVMFPIALTALWPENRAIWLEWSTGRAAELATGDAIAIGMRWSLVFLVAVTACVVGALASHYWISALGRNWVSVAAAITIGGLSMAGLIVATRWFSGHATWADAELATWELIRWLPLIAAALLVAKAIALAIASRAVIVGNHASRRAVFQICMIWLLIISCIGGTLSVLIPHPAVSIPHCFVFAMLVVPLASVVILPLCLSLNRHR